MPLEMDSIEMYFRNFLNQPQQDDYQVHINLYLVQSRDYERMMKIYAWLFLDRIYLY
jgi:hypothetical protein